MKNSNLPNDIEMQQFRKTFYSVVNKERFNYNKQLPSFKESLKESQENEKNFQQCNKDYDRSKLVHKTINIILSLAMICMGIYLYFLTHNLFFSILFAMFGPFSYFSFYILQKDSDKQRNLTLGEFLIKFKDKIPEIEFKFFDENFNEFKDMPLDKFMKMLNKEFDEK